MGLAERFKNKIENKDIFQVNNIEKVFENSDIQFISTPINKKITIDAKPMETSEIDRIEKIGNLITSKKNKDAAKFEDLESEIISKIRKTPYWSEYSIDRQSNMIAKYFDSKIQSYGIGYSETDKNEFVQNILALSNSK